MTVIYAEKPSAARTIADALNESGSPKSGNGYITITYKGKETIVTWGFGHLCTLKQAKDYNEAYKNWSQMPLPFVPCPYETKFQVNAKDQIKIVYDLFKKADFIINATDYDREGELIFYYLYTTMKCKKPFKRAHYSSMTKGSLRTAFDNLVSSDDVRDITDAGRARSIADWVVGSNLTVALTLNYANSGILSVGRVQTPTLNIIVEREKQIRNFKKESYFVLTGEFQTNTGEVYKGEAKTRYATQNEVPSISNTGAISKITSEQVTKEPPHFYSQSSLAMAANERFGYTLQETLDISQSLYEQALVTYPRTDSQYLPQDMYTTMCTVINSKLNSVSEYAAIIKGRKLPNTKYYFDDSKVDSHYAIVPTGKTPSGLNPKQEKVYDLICRNVISAVCGQAVLNKTAVTTQVDNIDFLSYGSSIDTLGWFEAMGIPKETILPKLGEGEVVSCKSDIAKRETKPPKAFTDKTIVAAMIGAGKELDNEELKKVLSVSTGVKGIGTEATRAAIIETLVKREYIVREKKTIRATDKGIALIDTIPIEDIKSPALTAEWELRLDKIAKGQESLQSFLEDIHEHTGIWCEEIKEAAKTNPTTAFQTENANSVVGSCPKCGQNVVKKKWGYGCSGWKKDGFGCDFAVSNVICGKKISDKNIYELLGDGKTRKIKGFTSPKTKKKFSACLKIDDNFKVTFDFDKK